MILKIRRKKSSREDWTIIPNIEEMNYERITGKEGKVRVNHNLHRIKCRMIISFDKNWDKSDDFRFLEIWISTNHNNEYIYTDDIVYILNDNGKTIDKICV